MNLVHAFWIHLIIGLGSAPLAWSDVATKVMLGKGAGTESPSGFQSGRYKVEGKKTDLKTAPLVPELPTENPPPKRDRAWRKKLPASEGPPHLLEPVKEAPVPEAKEPSINDQFKSLFVPEEKAVESYKVQIHPDDIRHNILEVDALAGLMQNSSQSSYSYRNYSTYSPYFNVGARIWPAPSIGLSGFFANSMAADMAATGSSGARVAVKQEFIDLGLDFRRFFGMSRRSNSLTVGLSYYEYRLSVPFDETTRVKLRSQGLGVRLSARLPTAPSYAWTMGGQIEPRITHDEQATALDLKSGSSPQASRFGLQLGGEIKMSRRNQLIWNLDYKMEKNQFSDLASTADPESGLTPRGVSVTNSFLLFSFGYRWGH